MERAETWPLATLPGWCEWQKGDARALEFGHCRWCGSTLTRWIARPARRRPAAPAERVVTS